MRALLAFGACGALAACGRLGFDHAAGVDGGGGGSGFDAPNETAMPVAAVAVLPSGAIGTTSIGWDGAGYGVAWMQAGTTYPEIYFMRLDINGVPVTTPLQVWDGSTADSLPEVIAGAGRYGVGWRFGGASAFQQVSSQGVKIGADYHSSTAGINQPTPLQIGVDGDHFALIWGQSIFNNQSILFSLFDAGGTATVESQLLVGGAALSMLSSRPYWNGAAWVVGGRDGDQVWSRRFADQPIGSAVRLDTTSDPSSEPAFVQTDAGMAAVWVDSTGQTATVMYRQLDRDGVPVADPLSVVPWPTIPTIAIFKRTASGSELWLANQGNVSELSLDGGGTLVGSPAAAITLPQGATLCKTGPGLAMTWVNTTTGQLWFQRL